MTDFTDLDSALTTAGVAAPDLPVWRLLFVLENRSRRASNDVPDRPSLTPTKFVTYLQQLGVLDEE